MVVGGSAGPLLGLRPRSMVIMHPQDLAGQSSPSWGRARQGLFLRGRTSETCALGVGRTETYPGGRMKPWSRPLIVRLILVVGYH
jgi:hypothetical protein